MVRVKRIIFLVLGLCFFGVSLHAKPFRLLSIDGGGVRGIVPARILHEIEKRTGKPISQSFDLIVGNSTGGLITLALVMPGKNNKPAFSAKDLLNVYLKRSHEIFPKSLWRNVTSGWGIWSPRYDRADYDKVLCSLFKDIKMSDALTPCVVVSYSIDHSLPHFWPSRLAKENPRRDYYMRDIAGATSAAPTYFAPKVIQTPSGKRLFEIDGGIYANNPTMIGVLEAFRGDSSLRKEETILISIGTGKSSMNQKGASLQESGVIGWMIKGNLMSVMMDASSELEDSQASTFFKSYHRLQIVLPKDLSEMDNSAPENLQGLLKETEDFIKQNDELINHICERIS